MSNIFLDIETVPGQSNEVIAAINAEITEEVATLSPPKSYKKEETIAAWMAKEEERLTSDEEFDARHHKCGLSGLKGEIISISAAVDDGEAFVVSRSLGDSETDLLIKFWTELTVRLDHPHADHTWIGHNIRGFDLPFIYHRSVMLCVKPPLYLPKASGPSDRRVYDTMTEWAGWGRTISQDALATALGLPCKPEGMDGSKVWEMAKAGMIREIAEYNQYDVQTVREIHRRLTFGAL